MATKRMQALTTVSQWLACAHVGTSLLPADDDPNGVGIVALATADPVDPPTGPSPVDPGPAGLVVTADCRVYHAWPEQGRIVRVVWHSTTGTSDASGEDVLADPSPAGVGDFTPVGAPADDVRRAAALALAGYESADVTRLFALYGGGAIVALDLGTRRVVRQVTLVVPLPPAAAWTVGQPAVPLVAADLATSPTGLLVACASRAHPLWRVTWHGDPVELDVPLRSLVGLPAGAVPTRVAADAQGRIWLLWRAPGADPWATPVADERTTVPYGPLPGATDIELDGEGALIVAAGPGQDLRVVRFAAGAASADRPLRARRSDGRGLARTPDGRIAFWTAAGLRSAFGDQVRYVSDGRVYTTALDSGVFHQQWGRLFIDACVPPGTSISVAMLTSDDLPGDDLDPIGPLLGEPVTIARSAPSNVVAPPAPDPATLPLPAAGAELLLADALPLFRRGSAEQPWVRRSDGDPFLTYEAPVNAQPGRYLWLRISLSGTAQRTPRVRAIRVETSGPRLVQRLPQIFSEDATGAAFLDRYLQLLDGTMLDLAAESDAREVLFGPESAAPEMLPWIASLVGLMLDRRWPEPVRRTMISEAVSLFRRRGTLAALQRMCAIVLGVPPMLVERFRFRGLTGAVGTALIRTGSTFGEYAHRFSVIVPGAPSSEQLDMLHDLITEHRPAHTLFEICSASMGSRLGLGMHLDLTAVIGRGSGFEQFGVGGVLGRGGIIGRPDGALRVGSGGLGRDARVEP